jgi:ketosteroid isomerase-like protein
MKKLFVAFSVLSAIAAGLLSLAIAQGSRGSDADAVAAITKILNDMARADLAGDASFYQNNLADDWTGGNSRGGWDTKQSIVADLKDIKNNKVNSERITEIKVRVHGDVAIATFKNSYDALIKGQRYTRTVICTDTFQRQSGSWKVLADHCSQTAS